MRLVGSTSAWPLSALIRWGSGDPCSHFSVVLYEDEIDFQSNFFGVDFESYKVFQNKNQIVEYIEIPMEQVREDAIFDSMVNAMASKGYDFRALLYFIFRGFLFKFFRIPMPTKNKWASSGQFLCTEIATGLPDDVIPPAIKTRDLSMVTPHQLLLMVAQATGREIKKG